MKDGRSSSSSGLSSSPSSSSEEEEEYDEEHVKKAKPGPRLHPVPQKRPQILVTKPDLPRKKKRGRKPLHPDLKALRPPLPLAPPPRHHQPIRSLREEPRPGVKKPLQPASFTYAGLNRTSRDEGTSSSHSSFSQSSASKPGALSCIWTGRSLSASSSSHKTGPSQKNSELRRSVSETGSGFKASYLRPGSTVAPLGPHSSFGGGPTAPQRPQLGQRRQEGPGCQQNSTFSKQSASSPTTRDRASKALSLRALNLQSISSSLGGNLGSRGAGKGPAAGGQRCTLTAGGAAERGRGREAGIRQEERRRGPSSQNRSLNELSTGDSDETSSSGSEHDTAMFPDNSRPSLGTSTSDTETDWRPARSLLEHVFVTDVTANFITVTVKESPTSVGFFSSRNH